MTGVTSLYSRVCPSWEKLDRTVRRFHDNPVAARASGRFDVVGGGWFARVLGRIAGLPRAGEGIPASVEITPERDGETWRRKFGESPFVSEQRADARGLLLERIGIVEFRFLLRVDEGALYFDQIDASVCLGALRLVLPRWLAPRVDAHAWRAPEGEYWMCVEVEVHLPLVGRLVGYRGRLELARETA